MSDKTMSDKLIDAIEKMLNPYKDVKRQVKPVDMPKEVCAICNTAVRGEKLIDDSVVKRLIRLAPEFAELFAGDNYKVCSACLERYLRIVVSVRIAPRRTKTVTLPFKFQYLEKLVGKPKVTVRIRANRREIRRFVQRRLWRFAATQAIWDSVNRLYEGYERRKRKPSLPRLKPDRITTEDVLAIIKGDAVPRPKVTIGCKGCTKAVCPANCPRLALARQLEIFKNNNVIVDLDEFDLSAYEDFP